MSIFKSPLSAPITRGADLRMEIHPATLRFVGQYAHLEEPFSHNYATKFLTQIRVATLMSAFLYAAFGALDAIVAPDIKHQLWSVRFGVVCPSMILFFLFSYSPHFPKYMQIAMVAVVLIAGLGIVYMTYSGNAVMASTYYTGLLLVLMIAYTFIRARFIWATICCWTIVVTYVISAAMDRDLAVTLLVNNAFFCITANVIGMLVCYAFEYYTRRDFFMRHILNEQHHELEVAKGLLEDKVRERTALLASTNEDLRREIQAHQRVGWEKEALENQLRHAQKMEAIGTLASGIAHDFNNILAAIMGHSELARMQLKDPEQAKQALSEVLTASDRAKDLVGQILAFSRHSESELKPLQISSVIKEALRLLRASLPATIVIEPDIRADNSIVVADVTQIHQILMNLCTNAAHAMEKQGGTLKVRLDESDQRNNSIPGSQAYPTQLEPGKYVCLSIIDTGHGIADHLLERIFDPYFTTKAKGVGTGLGLAVVLGIVQNHGGSIDVQSELGAGTTFRVYLPLVENQAKPEHQRLPLQPRGNEKILLVDDEAGLAELGAKLLSTLGYRATFHTEPQKALEVFQAHPDDFDLVITDLMMPEIHGKSLAKKLLAIRPDIPIIVYTGFSEAAESEDIKQMGVRAILLKPITIYGLSKAIRSVLEESSATTK